MALVIAEVYCDTKNFRMRLILKTDWAWWQDREDYDVFAQAPLLVGIGGQ